MLGEDEIELRELSIVLLLLVVDNFNDGMDKNLELTSIYTA